MSVSYTGNRRTEDGRVEFEREGEDPPDTEHYVDETGAWALRRVPASRWTDWVPAAWVTVYSITRHRGGHEEGGWYYDHREVACSVPTDGTETDAAMLVALLTPRFESDPRGRGSVLGGTDYEVNVEPVKGMFATRERPTYE